MVSSFEQSSPSAADESARIRLFKEQPSNQDDRTSLLNWAKTRPLGTRAQLHSPKTMAEIQTVVKSHRHIRPLGSRLTYEALTCVHKSDPNAIMLDLSEMHGMTDMTATTATFYAGTTIDKVSEILKLHDKYINCSPGVIGVQTLAGAIGTGTHGQGLGQSFLCDIVTRVELVIADGSVLVIDKQTNPELLDAVRIHLGVLGILVKVTLETQPLRILTCTKATISLADFKKSYIDLNRNEEFCKGWWFTNTGLVHVWSASPSSTNEINQYKANECQITDVEAQGDTDRLASTIYELEQKMAQDTCSQTGRQFETVQRFKKAVSVTGTIQQIYMKGIPVPQINCEIAIPMHMFEGAVLALQEWTESTHHELHYPFIFRCTGASKAWLAPHRGQDLCYIGFLVYLAKDGTASAGSLEMMREIQSVLARFGGTPHWGKHMALDVHLPLTQLYPKLVQFCAVMLDLDPFGKWQNDFTRDLFKHAVGLVQRDRQSASVLQTNRPTSIEETEGSGALLASSTDFLRAKL